MPPPMMMASASSEGSGSVCSHADRAASTAVAPAVCFRLTQFGLNTAQFQGIAVGNHGNGLFVVDELDILFQSAFHLVLAGGNFFRSTAVDDFNVLATGHPLGSPTSIHGHITATDHGDDFRRLGAFTVVDTAQITNAVNDARVIVAFDLHGFTPPCADGEQDCVVAFLQLIQRDTVITKRCFQVNLDARTMGHHAVNVFFDDADRQTECRDTPGHHTAQSIRHFIDMNLVSGFGQILCRRQASRSSADDTDGLFLRDLADRQAEILAQFVHDIAFQVTDSDGAIAVCPATGRFTRRITDPAANGTERVGCRNRLVGFLDLAFPDVTDIGRRIGTHRTGDLTRRRHVMRQGHIIRKAFRRSAGINTVDVVNVI